MPSLLSYRFERLLHEKLPAERSTCHLLAVTLYVEDPEQEKIFYTQLLGCLPRPEAEDAYSFTLADGLRLILAPAVPDAATSKAALQPHTGQVKLDLEATELMSAWHALVTAAIDRGKELYSLGKQQVLKALSPTGLLLCLRQKILQ
jgi:catechol 2,3-dioxygenase-like lactoylglutathione lyase family enzyme